MAVRIPERLRNPVLTAFVMVMVSPVVLLYNSLLSFRALVLYKLTITPQVVFLEKLLNDRYDNVERRIFIADGKQYTPTFLFTKAELKPFFLFRKAEVGFLEKYFFLKNETGQFTWDFVIHIPAVINFNQNELVALVNTYKLPAKTFKIKII